MKKLTPSAALDWNTYRQVRSMIFTLRICDRVVTFDTVSASMKHHLDQSMRRATLLRYLRAERLEDYQRQQRDDRCPYTEVQFDTLIRPMIDAAGETFWEPSGNPREPEFVLNIQQSGTLGELFTRQNADADIHVEGVAYAPPSAPEPDAVDEEMTAYLADAFGPEPVKAPIAAAPVVAEPPSTLVPLPAPKQPRNRVLPFDGGLLAATSALLNALWPQIEPNVGRSLTKTDWVTANRVAARGLITARAAGADPASVVEELVSDHRRISEAWGEPIREIRVLQRELLAESSVGARPDRRRRAHTLPVNLRVSEESEREASEKARQSDEEARRLAYDAEYQREWMAAHKARVAAEAEALDDRNRATLRDAGREPSGMSRAELAEQVEQVRAAAAAAEAARKAEADAATAAAGRAKFEEQMRRIAGAKRVPA